MLVSGSGLLKKKKKKKRMLSTGRSEGAFQIEVRAHDQRRSWEGRGSRGVLVSMMSMHVHTRVYGARCWCA